MSAIRGKSGKSHGTSTHKRKMTRGTKIRKRVFGITSLVLALVLANIPMGSQAMLVGGTYAGTSFRLQNSFAYGGENGTFEISSDSVDPGDNDTRLTTVNTTTTDPAASVSGGTTLASLLLAKDSYNSKTNYTGLKIYGLGYTNNNGTDFADNTVSGWNEAKLKVGISSLDKMFNFRDAFWVPYLEQHYNSQKLFYVYRDYLSGGTDGWVQVSGLTEKTDDGFLLSAEGIPAGFYNETDTNGTVTAVYKITHAAVAYREQMEKDITGMSESYSTFGSNVAPGYLMASCINAVNAKTTTLEDKRIMKFGDVSKNTSVLKTTLERNLNNSTAYTADEYYQFKLQLLKGDGNPVTSDDANNRYAISVPLPPGMAAEGNNSTGNYRVFRLKENISGNLSSVEELTTFDVVRRTTPNGDLYMLQFDLSFNATEIGYQNDFAVVFDASSVPPSPGNVTVTFGVNLSESGRSVAAANKTTGAQLGTTTNATSIQIPSGTSIRLTATPANFQRWSSTAAGSDTLGTTNILELDNITANVSRYAIYSSGTTPDPAQQYTLSVRTDPSGAGSTSGTTSGTYDSGTQVGISAAPNPGYKFSRWVWSWDNNAYQPETIYDAYLSKPLNASMTATAFFEPLTLTYQRNAGTLVAAGKGSTENATLLTGTLAKDTELWVKPVDDVSYQATLGNAVLGKPQYQSSPETKVFDYFNLSLSPSDGITEGSGGFYEVQITDIPIPAGMDSAQQVDLWLYDPVNGPQQVPIDSKTTDGKISFKTREMGDYILVNLKAPSFSVDDNRGKENADGRKETPLSPAAGGSTDTTQLNGTRWLEIEVSSQAYITDAEDGFVDENGNTVDPSGFDEWKEYSLRLYGKNDTNPRFPIDDIESIDVTLPVRLNKHSDDVKMYRVEQSGGTFRYYPLVEGTDFNKSSSGTVTTVTFNTSNRTTPAGYNVDYLLLFSNTPEFAVVDKRDTTTDARATDSKHLLTKLSDNYDTSQGNWADNRFIWIENVSPETNSEIEQEIRKNSAYDNYVVLPYEIRYVDDSGTDRTDYNPNGIRLELTIPQRAKGKFNYRLASLDKNGASSVLYLPHDATFINTDEAVRFTATHFSPYALLYLEEEPKEYVTITHGTSTPAEGGSFAPGTSQVVKGDTVTLTAYPAAGHDISHWQTDDGQRINVTGTDANGNKTGTFTATRDTVVNAFFTAGPFTVQAFPDPSGGGTVNIVTTPVGGPYPAGETVVIQAQPSAGQKVDYWEDNGQNIAGSANRTTYTINGIDKNHTVIVHFIDESASNTDTSGGGSTNAPVVNVTPVATGTPGAGGTVTQSTQGTQVTLTAQPQSGYHFKEWQDANGTTISNANPYTFTPVGTVNLRAVFEPDAGAVSGTGSVNVVSGAGGTGGNVNVTQTTTGGKGSNSIDMPRTGLMDHYNVYKMLGVVILTMFGVLELVSSMNTKRRKVVVD